MRIKGIRGPRRGYVVLAVLVALLCVTAVVAVVKTGREAAVARTEAASYTPPVPTNAVVPPVTVVVIGDQTALPPKASGTGDGWPAGAAEALGADVTVSAGPGAGYISAGTGGSAGSFAQRAARINENADAVVLFGGAADSSASRSAVLAAAGDAIDAVQERAPDAKIVVVGPVASTSDVSRLAVLRSALRSAAEAGGHRYVDPISSRWLSDTDFFSNGGPITAAGAVAIAAQMAAILQS